MSGRHSDDRAADVAMLFDGARLTLARQLRGLRKTELATRLGRSPSIVSAWESGAKRPTAASVAELALGLSMEPGFFAVRPTSDSHCATPHFRSLRSTSQLVRDQAFAYGRLAVDIAAALERHVEFPAVDIPDTPITDKRRVDGTEPEQAAQQVRAVWGLGDGPLGHLVRALESHGVLVVFSTPHAASVDAHSFDSGVRPAVILNPLKGDYYRQRFDVAHELGHLVMHADAEPGGRIVENEANRFAAEFLMPANEIQHVLPTTMSGGAWRDLAKLKEQWGVSMQALLYRARWLGCLSDVSYRNAMATVSSRGWRRAEPGLMETIEQPSLLPKAVELLADEGIFEEQLVGECRVPTGLFRTVTARTPHAAISRAPEGDDESYTPGSRLTSVRSYRE